MNPQPVQGWLKDQAVNLNLLWKPQPRLLLALTASSTRRTVSDSLSSAVNPYTNLKTVLNLTYYP